MFERVIQGRCNERGEDAWRRAVFIRVGMRGGLRVAVFVGVHEYGAQTLGGAKNDGIDALRILSGHHAGRDQRRKDKRKREQRRAQATLSFSFLRFDPSFNQRRFPSSYFIVLNNLDCELWQRKKALYDNYTLGWRMFSKGRDSVVGVFA